MPYAHAGPQWLVPVHSCNIALVHGFTWHLMLGCNIHLVHGFTWNLVDGCNIHLVHGCNLILVDGCNIFLPNEMDWSNTGDTFSATLLSKLASTPTASFLYTQTTAASSGLRKESKIGLNSTQVSVCSEKEPVAAGLAKRTLTAMRST